MQPAETIGPDVDAHVALSPTCRALRPRREGWSAAAVGTCCGAAALGAGAPLPAVVVAAGLGALAVTDWADHRLPGTVVRATAVAFTATAVGAALVQSTWGAAGRAAVAATVIAIVLGSLWLAFPGAIAFGDVKVTGIAAAAAAASSWRALVVLVLAAPIGAAAAALVNRSRRAGSENVVVPFAPGLAVAFVVGMVFG